MRTSAAPARQQARRTLPSIADTAAAVHADLQRRRLVDARGLQRRQTPSNATRLEPRYPIGPDVEAYRTIISNRSIEIKPESIEAIRDYGRPPTVGGLRSFLGMVAQVAPHQLRPKTRELALLHRATSNVHASASRVDWTDERIKAFDAIRQSPAFLITDASDVGYG